MILSRLLRLVATTEIGDVLLDQGRTWHSLDVLYEKPRVERLWTQLDDEHRLMLHRIHPCDKPLLHSHPWPSAVFVVSGRYVMNLGYGEPGGDDREDVLPLCMSEYSAGSLYSMGPYSWHDVNPLSGPSLSIMITGKPWGTHKPTTAEQRALNKPLTEEAKYSLSYEFGYLLRNRSYGWMLGDRR